MKIPYVRRSAFEKAIRERDQALEAEGGLIVELGNLRAELVACRSAYAELASGPERVRARLHKGTRTPHAIERDTAGATARRRAVLTLWSDS